MTSDSLRLDHGHRRSAAQAARAARRRPTLPLAGLLGGLAAGLVAGLVSSGPAAAGPLTTGEILRQFNVVSLGSMASWSNVEGRGYVGGSLHGGQFHTRTTAPASALDELVVGGSLSGNVKLDNGGDATVGGSGSGVLEMNAGPGGSGTATFGGTYDGTFNQGNRIENAPIDLPGFASTLSATSGDLAALGGSAPTIDGSVGRFELAPDADGLAVYDIADGGAFFGAVNEIDFALNGAETVIVNVGGSALAMADNFLGGPFDAAPHVLWNFHEATSLTFWRQFFGSVLAPEAFVMNFSAIEGTLVAGRLKQLAQVHLQPFEGSLPGSETGPGTPPVEVPAPGSLALLLAGLGLLWLVVACTRPGALRA